MNTRLIELESWLKNDCLLSSYQLIALPHDASFRRYYRVLNNEKSFVAMDAPPHKENIKPFMAITNLLKQKNVLVPEIFNANLSKGFLLLTDFGDKVLLKELNLDNASQLYNVALSELAKIQSCRQPPDHQLLTFTADFMYNELQHFKEWFLMRYLKLTLTPKTENMLSDFFKFLAENASVQPQVFMHRDYHSANIMVLPNEQLGILDFQDAFIGPVTYDLVSLLRDCYISWPDTLIKELALNYKKMLTDLEGVSDQVFLRWFDLMGLQRHLKTLLTFSRKFCRDHSDQYLKYIPRTLQYIQEVAKNYRECHGFYNFVELHVLKKMDEACVQ